MPVAPSCIAMPSGYFREPWDIEGPVGLNRFSGGQSMFQQKENQPKPDYGQNQEEIGESAGNMQNVPEFRNA